MTKLDAGLMTSLPASDPGSAAVWGSKRIIPRPQSCLCLTWSGYPSNEDDDDFLSKQNVIINTQYGFQNKVSTNHAFVDVITNSYDNINSNQFTGLVFLLLTEAFNSVNYDILLLKLQHYSIRGSANQLIQSFLLRKQFVSIKVQNLSCYKTIVVFRGFNF